MGETSERFALRTSRESLRPISSPGSEDSRSGSDGAGSDPDSRSGRRAIHARETQTRDRSISDDTRMSRFTSSVWLGRIARALFSERIRHLSGPTLFGDGIASDLASNLSDTLSSPFDSDRVALAGTTRANGCSCSPSGARPTASDWKGSTGHGSRRGTFAERVAMSLGVRGKTVYPHPEDIETAMGFPISWTERD